MDRLFHFTQACRSTSRWQWPFTASEEDLFLAAILISEEGRGVVQRLTTAPLGEGLSPT